MVLWDPVGSADVREPAGAQVGVRYAPHLISLGEVLSGWGGGKGDTHSPECGQRISSQPEATCHPGWHPGVTETRGSFLWDSRQVCGPRLGWPWSPPEASSRLGWWGAVSGLSGAGRVLGPAPG